MILIIFIRRIQGRAIVHAQRQKSAREIRKFCCVECTRESGPFRCSLNLSGGNAFRCASGAGKFLWLANNVEEGFDYSHMPSGKMLQIAAHVDV
jgi:hypothetical protein